MRSSIAVSTLVLLLCAAPAFGAPPSREEQKIEATAKNCVAECKNEDLCRDSL